MDAAAWVPPNSELLLAHVLKSFIVTPLRHSRSLL